MEIESWMKADQEKKGERKKENVFNTVPAMQHLISGMAVSMQISYMGSCSISN